MPEAPEVETIAAALRQAVAQDEIAKVWMDYERLCEPMPPKTFAQKVCGQHFRRFLRKGKYIVIELDDYDLIAHMRMEGRFLLEEHFPQDQKHIHAVFTLSSGRCLCYQDTRKFGRIQLYEKKEDPFELPVLKKLGLDVLDEKLDGDYLYAKLQKKKIPVKNALLDQHIAAGIGNIYANEILFACRIHPLRLSCSLSLQECSELARQTQVIMKKAIAAKGTTIRTFSYDGHHAGSFQNQLQVHGRQGQPCPVCARPIERIVISQRSAYLCAHCQKKKS